MKDGAEKIRTQQFGKFSRIDAVVLASDLQQSILSRVADQYLRDMGLEQGVQPRRAGTFFKGHMQTATQAADKLENRFRFRFEDSLHDQLPVRIPNGYGDRCLMHIQPNILGFIHEGAPCR